MKRIVVSTLNRDKKTFRTKNLVNSVSDIIYFFKSTETYEELKNNRDNLLIRIMKKKSTVITPNVSVSIYRYNYLVTSERSERRSL